MQHEPVEDDGDDRRPSLLGGGTSSKRFLMTAKPFVFRLPPTGLCARFGRPLLPSRTAVYVAAWLRDLGLERYEPAFRENEIDWDVLPELTESDLERLGLPLRLRKKLLKAIGALSTEATAAALEAVRAPGTITRERSGDS
jgi:SAM domain (Sterile alpha motif)